jgi:hypothetical protein
MRMYDIVPLTWATLCVVVALIVDKMRQRSGPDR